MGIIIVLFHQQLLLMVCIICFDDVLTVAVSHCLNDKKDFIDWCYFVFMRPFDLLKGLTSYFQVEFILIMFQSNNDR